MKNIFTVILALLLTFVKGNCQIPVIIYQKKIFISDTLLIKASKYIILKTDKDFYNKFISLNEKISTNSMLVYDFKVNETNKLIVLFITNKGEIDKENSNIDYKQLLNCISSKKCDLPMDVNSAIEIVKKKGLRKGTGSWRARFKLYGNTKNTFIWSLEYPFGSNIGDTIIINAISGEEIDRSTWLINE